MFSYKELIFVDVETTGLDPANDQIRSLCAVRTNQQGEVLGGMHASFWTYRDLDPEINSSLYGRPFEPYPQGSDAMDRHDREIWYAFRCLCDGACWVGSHPTFDKSFTDHMFKELGWRKPELASHHLIDVGSMYAPYLVRSEIDSISQGPLTHYFLQRAQRHTSLDDVSDMIDLFFYPRIVEST